MRTPAPSWWFPIVFAAVLSLAATVFINSSQESTTDTKAIIQRLSTVEARQKDTTERLNRIESKLDRMIEWSIYR